ncbi:MAG: hypothetical protein KDD43_13710, partial [Bdellovibrionales bacterium]|nr:hypothetical protein [Bdellovibrionales bacterium]
LQDKDFRNEKGETLLHRAVAARVSLDVMRFLIREQIPLEAEDASGHTALDKALVPGWPEGFEFLVHSGASQASPTLALKFYETHGKGSEKRRKAFKTLESRHQALRWFMSLERCLPGKKPQKEDSERIQSARHGPRFLPYGLRKQILTPEGQWIPFQNSEESNHLVARATQGSDTFYFKVYPELPGLEAAVSLFTQKFLGFGAPYSDVCMIRGVPVLVSQGIEGTSLAEHLIRKSPELSLLETSRVVGLMLAASLINPEDGKPANYIVEAVGSQSGTHHYQLIGVDNDHAFVPAVVRETPQKDWKGTLVPTAQVKTILFCLDAMKSPIDAALRTRIINQKLDLFLIPWLRELRHVHRSLAGLVSETEFWTLYKKHHTYLGVPFRSGALRHLYDKHRKMVELLTHNPDCTPMDILYSLEPHLAKRYDRAFQEGIQDVAERFKRVDHPFYATTP